MTKYQLVFVKIKCAISKLGQIARNKELVMMQKGFNKLKDNIDGTVKIKAEYALKQVKNTLKSILKIKERFNNSLLSKFVCRWKNLITQQKLVKEINKKLDVTENNFKNDISAKERSITGLQQKLQKYNSEIMTYKETEKNLKIKLKEEGYQEDNNSNRKQSIDKNMKTIEDQVQCLEANAERLENENRDLKDKLESAEMNVGDFIQEVSEILDSHEFMSKY